MNDMDKCGTECETYSMTFGKCFYEEQIRADERAKTIDEFVKSLFANDVIDKSVVRRVAEQMMEQAKGGEND